MASASRRKRRSPSRSWRSARACPVDDAQRALVFAADNWHRGVLGIVASRLVERFHRPVFVLSRDPEDGRAQGSGRSIRPFHLLEALEAMPELFERFGGHRQAAGVTLLCDQSRVVPRSGSTNTPPRG